ncbi:tRNA pseudouridine(38-40) synthase TruA [Cecembia calidifontis]|jgi:tRNA pseudouridine38-40 synthase|uniref:tRNA pseudouridine synthase A n=1 Tax=Cecembia calidifontis TaxID=1187080 RepID=A0A4Q7P885_9BACT|nr:tRNA pseudouridine(38-40) synthase TruA [Cecembia calidifontis]RZS96067.1 tRNA pseudouridine38-40 synthase [Cecembia calidifontis]
MKTNRYFLELGYKGTHYHGWQIQQNAHTVQAELEKAISTILGVPTGIMGSGRTDTGVHASKQFAHFDTIEELIADEFLKKLNGILPKDIAGYSLRKVHEEAHTRFDAIWRSYVYRISLRKDPFEQESAWQLFKKPDIQVMNEAASLLLEHEDFQCFSKVKTDVNTFHCKIKEAYWEQKGQLLLFHITANRFLRGMVRAIVGTLIEVGTFKITVEEFQRILESKNRNEAKAAAPAHGLFLCDITYPDNLFI